MSRLPSERVDLVQRVFWHAAEDDYICARICAKNGLPRHFAWNAGQAIEKYTKCLILLAGGAAKFGHKFVEPFQEKIYARNRHLFPAKLDIGNSTNVREDLRDFASEPLLDCLQRFETMGDPKLRYNELSHLLQPYDLQKLDHIAFLFRRLCYFPPAEIVSAELHADQLSESSEYSATDIWPTISIGSHTDNEKESVLRWENCINFPNTCEESKGWYWISYGVSPIDSAFLLGKINESDLDWLEEVSLFQRT